jgi:5-methylcytosine-specific restriction endonuclease McrA
MKRLLGETNAHLESRRLRTRTYTIYSHQAILADKANAKLDYGLPELRTLVAASLGTDCQYCHEKLRGRNFSLDHKVPISRGGSFSFRNLDVICAHCNMSKSELTSEEFSRLNELLNDFDGRGKRNVLRRLSMGAKAFRLLYIRTKKPKTSVKPEVLISNEEFPLQ